MTWPLLRRPTPTPVAPVQPVVVDHTVRTCRVCDVRTTEACCWVCGGPLTLTKEKAK